MTAAAPIELCGRGEARLEVGALGEAIHEPPQDAFAIIARVWKKLGSEVGSSERLFFRAGARRFVRDALIHADGVGQMTERDQDVTHEQRIWLFREGLLRHSEAVELGPPPGTDPDALIRRVS
jgi:hypothetical protein